MIVTDETFLRRASEPVRNVKEGGEIARKLSAALDRVNKKAAKAVRRSGEKVKLVAGVGLAAPQIGILKRVCLLRPALRPWVLMNPVVVAHSDQRVPVTEGCLSFPGLEVKTWRYVWVEVDTLNHGRLSFGPRTPSEWSDQAILLSVVAQHEIGHTLGRLFTDFARDADAGVTGLGRDSDGRAGDPDGGVRERPLPDVHDDPGEPLDGLLPDEAAALAGVPGVEA